MAQKWTLRYIKEYTLHNAHTNTNTISSFATLPDTILFTSHTLQHARINLPSPNSNSNCSHQTLDFILRPLYHSLLVIVYYCLIYYSHSLTILLHFPFTRYKLIILLVSTHTGTPLLPSHPSTSCFLPFFSYYY